MSKIIDVTLFVCIWVILILIGNTINHQNKTIKTIINTIEVIVDNQNILEQDVNSIVDIQGRIVEIIK
jgi:hypothetical protein